MILPKRRLPWRDFVRCIRAPAVRSNCRCWRKRDSGSKRVVVISISTTPSGIGKQRTASCRVFFPRRGFSNVSADEVKGSVQVLDGSLAGPKGARLKGQIDSLVVLRADTSYEMGVKRGRPSSDWIDQSALQLCNR